MRTIRCYSPGNHPPGSVVTLDEGESRHLAAVLRLGPGDPVLLIDGAGKEYAAEVSSIGKKAVSLTVRELARSEPRPMARWLCMALVKSATVEDTLQRAVELGMTKFLPLETDRTIVELDEARAVKRVEKWTAHAVEALKQSERLWLPSIHTPLGLSSALELAAVGEVMPVALVERMPGIDSLDAVAGTHGMGAMSFLVGPEGGWSVAEREHFNVLQVRCASLGESAILRTETAALAALAMTLR